MRLARHNVYGNVNFNFSCLGVFFSVLGIHLAKRIDKLGMRSSDTAQIFFEDVRVPQKNVIGDEGMGFTYQMLQFQEERLWAAVGSEYFHTLNSPIEARCAKASCWGVLLLAAHCIQVTRPNFPTFILLF